jgi:hypothetical protein
MYPFEPTGMKQPVDHQRKEITMSPQRARMIEDMILVGFAPGDAEALCPGGASTNCALPPPDQLSEEEVVQLAKRTAARSVPNSSGVSS